MRLIEAVLFDFSGVVAHIRPTFIGEDGPMFVAEPVTEVVDAVLRLKEAKFKTCLVSNFDRQALLESARAIDFDAMFDDLVFSSDGNFAKPDRQIYEWAAQKIGADKERCLFVDDLARNVDGAIACGMQGVIAVDAATVVTAIDDLISLKLN